MTRQAARVDENQGSITAYLEQRPGVSWHSTAMVANGFPDLVIGYRGINELWEIKDGSKPSSAQRLTHKEYKFHERWRGSAFIVRSVQEAEERLAKIETMMKGRRVE